MSVRWPIVVEEPGNNGSYWEPNRSSATITYRVPQIDLDQAVFTFMGYSYRQGGNLRRVLPEKHPYWRHLRAVRLQENGDVFRSKADLIEGAIDRYDERLITVYYEALPYPIKPDGDVSSTTEYLRYVRKLYRPTVEVYTQRKGTFTFDVADGAPTPAEVAADLPIRLPIVEWDWTWYQVPPQWIFGTTAGANVATNILNRIEKVNDATFENCLAKTLRLVSVELEEVYTPAPDLIFGAPVGENPWLRYNVHLKFKMNPAGWHRLPHPEDNNFYRVQTSGGDELFQTASFPTIFAAL